MPTNTLDKIRHSLSCVAVLFGLFGIFVFASFSPSYAWLYLGGLAAPFIYSIVFVYAIAAWSIYSKYYPFLSLGRLSFVECFVPALAWCALPFSTMFLVARNPGWPSYQGNFFFINFLTRWRCAFWLLWRRKLYSEGFY